MSQRLTGFKPLLTRNVEDSTDWTEALKAEGALPIVLPCIETKSCQDDAVTARLLDAVTEADWIVFTSRRGVNEFADRLPERFSINAKFAAVAASTAACLAERVGQVDHIGGGTARALAAEMGAIVKPGERVVLALAANAGDVLQDRLTEAGARVTRFDLYRTIPKPRAGSKRALSTLGCDAVIFASPTAVAGFDNQIDVDSENRFVTIGPSTSDAVRERHWPVAAEAKQPNLTGIIESLLEADHV